MYMLGALDLLPELVLHSSFHLATSRHIDAVASSPPRLHFLHNLMNGFVDVSGRITRHPQKRVLLDFFGRLLCMLVFPLQLLNEPWFGRRGKENY